MRVATLALGISLVLAAIARAEPATAQPGEQLFRESIAPILERRCVSCHSGDEPKGGLSLASAEALRKGGESGSAVVAGKPDESLIVSYISGDEPEMPKGQPRLAAADVAAIRSWVESGAPWPAEFTLEDRSKSGPWWSLAPVVRPNVPAVNSDWIRTPIDAFILAKHNELGLRHAAEADRRTLIRRLSFDLHGLPPTPEEVDAFLSDARPDAYDQLVDRLLASPRYGERWGRYWLDIVHYGESHGYDKDKPRPNAWPYRDYVIDSLNADKPYSRFVLEQLAGDVLFADDPQAKIATGFVAAGPWDFVGHMELREGTTDKEIARSNDRDDMVMTTMSTFTSMTVHCARCHDHKFDPIAQQDYYRLQAVFAGVDRADQTYFEADTKRERDEVQAQITTEEAEQKQLAEARAALTSPELVAIDARIKALTDELAAIPDPFAPDEQAASSPTNGYHSEIASKDSEAKWVQVDLGQAVAVDLVRLVPARPTDFRDTPGFGFPVRFRVSVSNDPTFATEDVIADHSGEDFPNPGQHPFSISPHGVTGRYVRVTAEKLWPRSKDFVFALGELQIESAGRNVAAGTVVTALDTIEAGRWGTKNLVDGFDSRRELPDVAAPAAAATLAHRQSLERDLDEQRAERARVAESLVPAELKQQIEAIDRQLTDLRKRLEKLEKGKQVYAVKSHEPREIHLLRRGDVKSPAEVLAPGSLGCVQGMPHEFTLADPKNEGSARAALAQWIVDPANVLTWRSIVNRVWQYHFGAGLVDTPNDFGRMGSLPSHPELLDWLAVEFREHGESLKTLHKLIVTSSVYRQASTDDVANARLDAANRFLWRQNRRRLDAEAVRDAVLATSGKLDLTMHGPSVRQFAFKDDHSPIYDYARFDVDDANAFRRSVYRFIVRSVPDPLMECLDCADPSLLTPKRNTTLTALQALAMMNNALFVRQAEHFAERVRTATADPREQIRLAYRLALAREPRDEESRLLVDYAAQHGLANTCRLIFNMNEFVFVD
jgi:mono/diheme cytochrome c family protein